MFRFGVGSGDFRRELIRVLGTVIVLGGMCVSRPDVAAAQTCGTDYTIKEGETLAQIAPVYMAIQRNGRLSFTPTRTASV
jgi:hypothetical protein